MAQLGFEHKAQVLSPCVTYTVWKSQTPWSLHGSVMGGVGCLVGGTSYMGLHFEWVRGVQAGVHTSLSLPGS